MANVLISSAGRRVELVQAFQQEAKKSSSAPKIFASDLVPELSAACQISDKPLKLPPVRDCGYLDALLELCQAHEIGMIVPTIDTDLELLAGARDKFSAHGTEILISAVGLVELCRDKRRTSELFELVGIDVPREYDRASIEYPCFIKPFDGSSGIGARMVDSPDDLSASEFTNENLLISELVDRSYDEYTIDAYFDRHGNPRCIVPRQRLAIRAGEVAKGVTRRNFVYDYFSKNLAKLEGGRGCLTIQVFARDEDESILGIEINPRFGGGYPLSYAAGANFPRLLISEFLENKDAWDILDWQVDLLMLRYDAKVIVPNYA